MTSVVKLQNTTLHNIDDVDLNKTLNLYLPENNTIINNNVLHDAEIIESFSGSSTVCDEFKIHTTFKQSQNYLCEILSHPIDDPKLLEERQNFLSSLNDQQIKEQMNKILNNISSINWIFTKRDKEIEDILNTVYYSWWIFKGCNSSSSALTMKNVYSILLSPAIGILSPIIYFIIPYFILRWKFKFQIPFKSYIKTLYQISTSNLLNVKGHTFMKSISLISYISSIVFYFQGILQSIETAKFSLSISTMITSNMNKMMKIYNIYKSLCATHQLHQNPFYIIKNVVHIDAYEVCANTNTSVPFSNFGEKLELYKSIPKEKLTQLMNHIYVLDALCAIKSTITAKTLRPSSFDLKSIQPYLAFKGLWHINLNADFSVKNDYNNNCIKKNSIITGPNAAGKSTFIKSLLVNIILSQTIAYCAADECIMTPFKYIGSQINIPDCKGKESLFEAEMYRCKENIDFVKKNPEKKSIIFMDEIFNSTNAIEGISGAYSILKNLAKYENTTVIITTHFPYLAKLHKDSNFSLYKFDSVRNEANMIDYTYKISKGLSRQYIALEILKEHAFDDEIISEANRVKDYILHG
jgi:hypothetical protein